MSIEQDINDLNAMDVEDMVDLFKANGIKGSVGNACDCPVTNYLKFKNPDIPYVASCAAMIDYEDAAENKKTISVSGTDKGIPKFIREFDQALMPELLY